MRKLAIVILATVITGVVHAQDIVAVLRTNQNTEYKTKRPKKIVETITSHAASGIRVEKSIKLFDDAGMLTMEEYYDEEGLRRRSAYTNDTINRLRLTHAVESWTATGLVKENNYYNYDAGHFLVSIVTKDAKDNILHQAKITNDQKGNPIELHLFKGNDSLIGKEKAVYLYDKNKVISYLLEYDGSIVSTDTSKINYAIASKYPDSGEAYFPNGDMARYTSTYFDDLRATTSFFYSYDRFGNCVERKEYGVDKKRKGKYQQRLDKEIRKEYVY
jgi:hypothetical protein